VNSVVMVIGTQLALIYTNRGLVQLQISVLPAAYLIFLELLLLVAVALLFSSFTTPMLAALYSFAIYVIGHFSGDLRLAAELTDSALTRHILTALYYVLPNLSNFGFIAEASHGRIVPLGMALRATVYAAVYIAILVSATTMVFQRRNFK